MTIYLERNLFNFPDQFITFHMIKLRYHWYSGGAFLEVDFNFYFKIQGLFLNIGILEKFQICDIHRKKG